MTLPIEHSALVLLDAQTDVAHPDGRLGPRGDEAVGRYREAVRRARTVLEAARAAGLTVVHVATRFRSGYPSVNPHLPLAQRVRSAGALVEGSAGAVFLSGFEPQDGEAVVVKRGISAFGHTDLEPLLRRVGVDTLLLAGFTTPWTVEGTARAAAERGYRVLTLSDCCASRRDERHRGSLETLAGVGLVRESEVVVAQLAGGEASPQSSTPPRTAPEHSSAPRSAPPSPPGRRPSAAPRPVTAIVRNRIMKTFKAFDEDDSGTIDRDEFAKLCAALNLNLDEVRLLAAFNAVDADGNGVIDFFEFIEWWQHAGIA